MIEHRFIFTKVLAITSVIYDTNISYLYVKRQRSPVQLLTISLSSSPNSPILCCVAQLVLPCRSLSSLCTLFVRFRVGSCAKTYLRIYVAFFGELPDQSETSRSRRWSCPVCPASVSATSEIHTCSFTTLCECACVCSVRCCVCVFVCRRVCVEVCIDECVVCVVVLCLEARIRSQFYTRKFEITQT